MGLFNENTPDDHSALALLHALNEKVEHLVAQIDDLNAVTAQIATDVTNVAALVSNLQGNQAPDLSGAISSLQASAAALEALAPAQPAA